ncbi:MAG TPA: hypothetical protein PK168_01160 [Candidatus Paceibacterota bacterium]|nr:hypothetical protein [Candidatus Paceibacterota bacterium]HPC37248.1 hypothetical protein [Candidatus Paceibacterota bacterium]HRU35705.1 hypothetical protein [Candidatus Paceibacterota bacterium]
METKKQIKEQLKKKYNTELTPQSDFTKMPDEILANAHLYDWYDKVSIQANVEMSRRLKNATEKSTRRMEYLTYVLVFLGLVQIVVMIFQICN